MLPLLVQYLSNSFHIFFSLIFDIDKDVLKVYYHKNIMFFYQNLIDIALKDGQYVG